MFLHEIKSANIHDNLLRLSLKWESQSKIENRNLLTYDLQMKNKYYQITH